MPRIRSKPVREVYCLYERKYVPMGRCRSRCPKCGAEVGNSTHTLRIAKHEMGTIDRMKEDAANA